MAQPGDANPEFPEAPELVAPRNEAVVDGEAVLLAWEPVEGAMEYRVEVSPATSFAERIFEESVGRQTTELTLPEALPADGKTYYWRVLARDENGWSHGDRVESFVSGTPEDLEERARHPEEGERPDEMLGPYPALIRSASAEASAEVTGQEQILEEEERSGVAHEGVEAGQILAIASTVLVAIALIILLLFFWMGSVSNQVQEAVVSRADYPELRETEAEASQLLDQYGVVDEAEGIYRIPIDRAMNLLVNEEYQQTDREYSQELPLPPHE